MSKKPSLLKAAESYTPAQTHPNWMAKLQQRDPALAEEALTLIEQWRRGQRPNFPHATSLAEFLSPHVGVSMDTIFRWIRRG
jgi:hypothetical protein